LSVLRRLDGERKGILLRFLQESQLISATNPIISLRTADLSKADLRFADLRKANLSEADLSEANLHGA
ncbi:MAG: pentapeptide repeat-containing protein, partial [Chloroflexota bacterium]|nr:pentapeptide repeat-containing protein [Chloroflexota bacterium]